MNSEDGCLLSEGEPAFGDEISPAYASLETLQVLKLRRSTQADLLGKPGPDEQTLKTILSIATRVPDHRRVEPFRFIIFANDGREKAGEVLANVYEQTNKGANKEIIARERNRFLRAPVVIGVISSTTLEHRTPEWEQVLTAGAVCQNMLLAACAYGFASQWLTEWYAYDATVLAAFGLRENEKIAGFIYMGTAQMNPKERKRPDVDALISSFTG